MVVHTVVVKRIGSGEAEGTPVCPGRPEKKVSRNDIMVELLDQQESSLRIAFLFLKLLSLA